MSMVVLRNLPIYTSPKQKPVDVASDFEIQDSFHDLKKKKTTEKCPISSVSVEALIPNHGNLSSTSPPEKTENDTKKNDLIENDLIENDEKENDTKENDTKENNTKEINTKENDTKDNHTKERNCEGAKKEAELNLEQEVQNQREIKDKPSPDTELDQDEKLGEKNDKTGEKDDITMGNQKQEEEPVKEKMEEDFVPSPYGNVLKTESGNAKSIEQETKDTDTVKQDKVEHTGLEIDAVRIDDHQAVINEVDDGSYRDDSETFSLIEEFDSSLLDGSSSFLQEKRSIEEVLGSLTEDPQLPTAQQKSSDLPFTGYSDGAMLRNPWLSPTDLEHAVEKAKESDGMKAEDICLASALPGPFDENVPLLNQTPQQHQPHGELKISPWKSWNGENREHFNEFPLEAGSPRASSSVLFSSPALPVPPPAPPQVAHTATTPDCQLAFGDSLLTSSTHCRQNFESLKFQPVKPFTTAAAATHAGGSNMQGVQVNQTSNTPAAATLQPYTARRSNGRSLKQEAVEIMSDWFDKHQQQPYPTLEEKIYMACKGGITVNQVTSWFSNKRNRIGFPTNKRMARGRKSDQPRKPDPYYNFATDLSMRDSRVDDDFIRKRIQGLVEEVEAKKQRLG